MAFIALEGGVCSGKSTVATILKNKINAQIIPEYMSLLTNEQTELLRILSDEERFSFFIKLDFERNKLIQNNLENIIFDRSFFTLFSYQFALKKLGLINSCNYISRYLYHHEFIHPELIIFFDVNDKVRENRLAARGNDTDRFFLRDDFNKNIRTFFERASTIIRTNFIDTNSISAVDVATLITQNLVATEKPVLTSNINRFLLSVFQEGEE